MSFESLKLRPQGSHFSEARFRQWLARKSWAFLDPHKDNQWHISATSVDARRAFEERLKDGSKFPFGAVIGLNDNGLWVSVRACADVYARIYWLIAWLLDSGPWLYLKDYCTNEEELRLDELFNSPLPAPTEMHGRELVLRPTILLFDIDGTLIKSAGVGRDALEKALVSHVGPGPWLDFPLNGMTDLSIIRKAFEQKGKLFSQEMAFEIEAKYVSLLKETIDGKDGYIVLPGVVDLLEEALTFGPKVVVGLGTGNFKRGAEIKLACSKLDRYFSFGGFGSDHEERYEMLEIGAKRGGDILGEDWEKCRVVVIGDTPRDIDAAHLCGAECLAVATGGHSVDELKAAKADWVFSSLAEPGVHSAVFFGRPD